MKPMLNQGSSYTNVFTGTLGDDGIIKGTIAVADVGGTFTAKKQRLRRACSPVRDSS